MKVEIWSDIACPWCYIGKRRFEKALAAFPHRDEVEVQWRSYQLDPTLPDHHDGTELDYLVDRKGMSRAQVSQMFDQVTSIAADEGLRYDFGSVVVANSFAGHELLHLAKARGVGDEVKEALLSAHFEHGEDIGDREVLVRIGTQAGLDADEIARDLATHTWRDAVVADITAANSLGIRGVPFFVLDEKYGVSGAQPTELFTQALEQAWRESHALVMLQPVATGIATDAADTVACGPDGC
ncbi:disulfide bond formation protein DsbA [Terrabacter sp. Root85]|uniref:DsbA family oxidoreductase n=1 Tax=Terrabacter sp. Root85 TaxID=1736603 RepID=UPI0006FFE9EE|nr:DsbA family oxidoreductase [Terrabacter sp. Root85]KRC91894.1 disulfide bond formation protein DsbA [Terrabacter sp. Root85]